VFDLTVCRQICCGSAREASPDDISITGAISDRYGVWILQPLIIAFLVADVALWALVPRHRRVTA
jgi:hypothetical protein